MTDPDILIDALIGLARVDARGSETVFVKLLADNNETRRIVALRAAQMLFSEQEALGGMASLRQAMAVPLRFMITVRPPSPDA